MSTLETAGVSAIVLAAGASTRMGEPKQLLPFEGRSLLRRAVDTALASRCETVVVVLGANALRIREEIVDSPVLVAINERWSRGMSTSVRAGLEVLEKSRGKQRISAAVLMPCDQPHLSGTVLNRLIDAHHANDQPIVVSGYSGIWGVPMLFTRSLWPELRALSGQGGAQSVALRHASEVECVPFPLGACDLDTRHDYEQLFPEAGVL